MRSWQPLITLTDLDYRACRIDYLASYFSRNPGSNPLAVDSNCGCFNPQAVPALNQAAWTDATPGRWQRQPSEAVSFDRNFRMGNGVNTAGYGYIAAVNGVGAVPRSGQMVARFTF